MSKKKILTVALCVALVAALVVGASIAYFTDTKEATNTFTIGNVKIELLESQYHRVNAGVPNGQTSTSPLWADKELDKDNDDYATEHGWNGMYYSDEVIEADAATYQSEYLAVAGQGILPGQPVRKNTYVKNTGRSDAYVRIRVLIEEEFDTNIDDSMYTGSLMSTGEGIFSKDTKTIGDTTYAQYNFIYTKPLAPNEITFWNAWGMVRIKADATAEEIAQYVENDTFDVLVQADAIQAAGFEDAVAAFAAFDAQMAASATTSPNP